LADAAHAWRMQTGIELLHKEPTLEEQQRIYQNWLQMSDEQKEESDKKSVELFGKTNLDNWGDPDSYEERFQKKDGDKNGK
jgi:hypothetical protein